ncbi:MAG: hypothetical protein U0232_16435 [Thermomicrobiales bacterium]
MTAKHADIWNTTSSDPDMLRHKVEVLHGHCATVRRDPSEIEISVQIPVNYDDPGATVQAAQGVVDAGATHHPQPAPALPGEDRDAAGRGDHPQDQGARSAWSGER